MPTLTQSLTAPPAPAQPAAAPQASGSRWMLAACVLLAMALAAVGGKYGYAYLMEQSAERGRESRNLQLQGLASDLQTEDSTSTDSVNAAIHLLRDNTLALGQPNLGPAKVAVNQEKALPDLRFGTHSVANDLGVVDEVAKAVGGTATVFVKSGERFVRVTTNVLTGAGVRAVGTELDPKGPAAAAMRENKTFSGVVDVLGKAYFAVYEPIHGANGETIGAWYTGFPVVSGK